MEQSAGETPPRTRAALGATAWEQRAAGATAGPGVSPALAAGHRCVQVQELDKEGLHRPGFAPQHSTLPSKLM